MKQLPLQWPTSPRLGPDDFLVSGSNAAAYAAVERWPDWLDKILVLVGPGGSGKTHLAHLWSERSRASPLLPGDFAGDLEVIARRNTLIDDADQLGLPEAGFFHLVNLVRENGSFLLITARSHPDRWGLATPDLLSRLRLAPTVDIEPPDEALIRAVLVKLFDDRQIRIESALVDHLALRLDRSLDMVGRVVRALDLASLSSGRRITRSMASAALQELQLDED